MDLNKKFREGIDKVKHTAENLKENFQDKMPGKPVSSSSAGDLTGRQVPTGEYTQGNVGETVNRDTSSISKDQFAERKDFEKNDLDESEDVA